MQGINVFYAFCYMFRFEFVDILIPSQGLIVSVRANLLRACCCIRHFNLTYNMTFGPTLGIKGMCKDITFYLYTCGTFHCLKFDIHYDLTF